MDTIEKNTLVADLYALRAGMSAISIEKDKLAEKEKVYQDAKRVFELAKAEYESKESNLRFCEKSYQEAVNSPKIYDGNDWPFKYFWYGLFSGLIGAAIPWFFYFVTSGAFESDLKYGDQDWYEPDWVTYLIVSACIFGFCLFGGLISFLVTRSSNNSEYRKKRKNEIEKSKKDIDEMKSQLSQTTQSYERAKRRLEPLSVNYENAKYVSTKLSKEMYDTLVAQFKSVLDIRDWEHIDLIIFNFETGRADTLKEALQQVDRRVQTDEIIEAVELAGHNIASTINVTMGQLRSDLNKSFNRLSVQFASQHAEQMAALGNINKNIERTNDRVAELQSVTEKNGKTLESISRVENLNNALLAKINYGSMSLMDDVNYMVLAAQKESGTNNTSYTFNLNVK